MELPKKLSVSDFYRYGVFLVYSFVIAQSFQVSTNVFIPFDKVITTYDGLENAFTLLLAYFFILSGWVNYYKSITITPHTEGKYGNETRIGTSRFCVDLLIIFLYNYLINLVPTKTYHGTIFVYVFPFIFICFLIWDLLRFFEYRNIAKTEHRKGERKSRLIVTGIFLLIIGIQAYFYSIPKQPLYIAEGIVVWNFVFTITTLGIVIVYRRITSETILRTPKRKR